MIQEGNLTTKENMRNPFPLPYTLDCTRKFIEVRSLSNVWHMIKSLPTIHIYKNIKTHTHHGEESIVNNVAWALSELCPYDN